MGWLRDMLLGLQAHSDRNEGGNDDDGWKNESGQPMSHKVSHETPESSDENTEESQESGDGTTRVDPYRDALGNKIRPEVEITHVKADLSGDSKHLELWATIKNHSKLEVEVTRTDFKGYQGNGHFLSPGESYETRIFVGDTPTNEAYHNADIQFKVTANGDYFQADHYVTYHYEQTEHGNFYIPSEFKLIQPIRDI